MSSFVFGFEDLDKASINLVGGKGANLGELSQIEGIHVPRGFCVSTEAFKRVIEEVASIRPAGMLQTGSELLGQLSLLRAEDRNKISELSSAIRNIIEGMIIPEDIEEEVTGFLA